LLDAPYWYVATAGMGNFEVWTTVEQPFLVGAGIFTRQGHMHEAGQLTYLKYRKLPV